MYMMFKKQLSVMSLLNTHAEAINVNFNASRVETNRTCIQLRLHSYQAIQCMNKPQSGIAESEANLAACIVLCSLFGEMQFSVKIEI